jgi:hypothetical protein
MATAKKKISDVPAAKKSTEIPAARVAARPAAAERRIEAPTSRPAARQPSYEDISRRAFEIWDRTGRPDGQDLENWLQAESELRQA